jgi:hypothetical protein
MPPRPTLGEVFTTVPWKVSRKVEYPTATCPRDRTLSR